MQIQYNDPNSTYWKDKYKTLPNEVGPYAENKEKSPAWMRSKGLRYGGQDGGGHFWVSKSGDIYHFDDVAPGSNSDTENTNSNNAGNNYNYTPSGNNILNTNAVTSPLQPIIYWPNNSNSVDTTPRANPGSGKNYENGHIASSSAATGKFGITETGGVTNYGSVPRDQVNSTTNEPMTEAGNIKPIAKADDQSSGGCDGDSYLYIVPLNDNKYDKAARQEFFDYMNDRSGGIFKFCPDNDGKVILKNKAKDWLSVEASPTVSKILAHTVCNAIEGGVGFNGASLMNHRIELKTTDFEKPLDANGAASRNWENIEKNNGCFFDDFRTGMIDVSDFRNLLNLSQHGLINGIKLSNEIIQAAIIGHVVCERSAYVWYNVWQNLNISDNNIYHQYATSAHPKGVKRECAIINEMATKELEKKVKVADVRLIPIDDIAVKKNQFFEFDPNDTKYQSSYPIPNIYPFDPYVSGDTKRPGAIIFIWTAYVRSKQLFPNYVTAAQLVYDEKFNLPKLGVDSGFKKNPNL